MPTLIPTDLAALSAVLEQYRVALGAPCPCNHPAEYPAAIFAPLDPKNKTNEGALAAAKEIGAVFAAALESPDDLPAGVENKRRSLYPVKWHWLLGNDQRYSIRRGLIATVREIEAAIAARPTRQATITKKRRLRWIELVDDDTYQAKGSEPIQVSNIQHRKILEKFIEAGKRRLTTRELKETLECTGHVVGAIMRNLVTQYGGAFEPFIDRPGREGKGQGYLGRVRESASLNKLK
jgi:hypothetical protein